MKRVKLFFLVLPLLSFSSNAQSQLKAFLGIGAGLDYGGLGIRAEFQPLKNIGIIGGLGYNLTEPAYNVGLSYKILPGKKVTPTIMAIYGYNAVIRVSYPGLVDGRTYYGPSVGAGCEVFDGRHKWTFEIFVPFRNSDFHDHYNELKDSGVEFKPSILPVTFTIGYNFFLAKQKD